jgi:OOP family OmpA-OmpF porin
MESFMLQSTKTLRWLVAALTLTSVVGCAQLAPQQAAAPAPHDAATSGPELAGAWYQIYFDTNSATLNDRGQMIVRNVAYVVANGGPARVTVIGKTDRVGAAPANLALSRRRADAVRDALVAAGVPAGTIDTSWSGEAAQNVSTLDDAKEPRNRAVDVTVVKQPG